MIYLFNSGYRPLYVKNVLNTLFLPSGYTNEYRYRYKEDPRHVPPAMYEQFATLEQGTECLICFIDRFAAQGYSYHPLRRGAYVSRREESDYIFIRVRLGDFIYPRNLNIFRQHIVQALGTAGLPALTSGDPESTNDGAYVIRGQNILGQRDDYLSDDGAWTAAVQDLSGTRALASTPEQSPVFLRAEICQSSKPRRRINPVLRDNSARYELNKGNSCELLLTYRFPRQRTDQSARAQLEVTFGDNIRPLGNTSINIDSHANSIITPFSFKRYIEDASGSIRLTPVEDPEKPKVLISELPLQYDISESGAFWLKTAVALLMFSLAGAFIGIDLSDLSPFTFSALLHAAWPKLAAGIIQTVALFSLFRLIGKKVV